MSSWPVWAKAFLSALAESANVTLACRAAEIGRTAVYVLQKKDTAFALAWADAIEEAADLLEAEARRRAESGVLEPVFYQGMKVGSIRRYSDPLMVLLLKAARPEKYRERLDQQITGKGGGPVQTMPVPFDPAALDNLSDAELALLESIIAKLNGQSNPAA